MRGILFILTIPSGLPVLDRYWRGSGLPPLDGGGGLWCKKRRECGGCGVGERLRDYWTPVYFRRYRPRGTLFYCAPCLSFSRSGFTLSFPIQREAIKALSAGYGFKAAVATSVDLLICEADHYLPPRGPSAFKGKALAPQ